ncbi:MAG: hypothetical protein VX498_00695 [Myxococcota bacterium]|nr:hypothetical protein [Myxococcota bacterium]
MKRPVLVLLALSFGLLLFSAPSAAQPARLISPEHAGNAMNPVWSPDGSQVSYEVSYAREKYGSLFLLDVGRGSEVEIKPSAGARTSGGRFRVQRQVNHEFTWSPSGKLYAFASSGNDDDFDIHIKGVSVPIGSEAKEGGASFSADGRYLSFTSARTGEGDLYLADIYGLENEARRLTSGPGLEFYAVWSPVGQSLVYTAMGDEGANIRIIRDPSKPESSDQALTTWKSTELKPSFSPDGRWVAFFSNHGRKERTHFDVYVVKATGGEPFRIARDVIPNERSGPAWTPDGQSLVVVRNDPNMGDPLVRVNLLNNVEQLIPTGTVNNGDPGVSGRPGDRSWSLVFVSQGKKGSDTQTWRRVWAMDLPADGAEPQ